MCNKVAFRAVVVQKSSPVNKLIPLQVILLVRCAIVLNRQVYEYVLI